MACLYRGSQRLCVAWLLHQNGFEFVSDGLTVCGGGRYDNLVEEIGGKPTGAVGFGLGIERLIMILEKQHGAITETPEEMFISALWAKGTFESTVSDL